MLNKLIEIKTSSRVGEKEYCGICILKNNDVLMLLNFNEETAQFEGFTLFRNDDVDSYYEWDEEDHKEIKLDNSKELISSIDPSEYSTFESALKKRQSTMICIFEDDDFDSYAVGKVEGVKDNTLTYLSIDTDAKWTDSISLSIDSIWYIGFDTEYENKLLKNAH